jgi:FAD/FMN-containing dehydrogenase
MEPSFSFSKALNKPESKKMAEPTHTSRDDLAAALARILGAENVTRDAEELRFYSADVYAPGTMAALAVSPGDRSTLAESVAAITAAGFAMTVRGGGMSYTGGYTPAREGTVVIDTRKLNRIVELNARDMYITVEAGVTWKQIDEALKPLGLRLPFFGTFSGSRATVGGGMSNGALFLGTARYGTAAEIVLGLEVIVADGSCIRTGQAAFGNGKPFYRTYGPDLTGLFVHDAGVLGVKSLITMRLIQAPACTAYASFVFPEVSRSVQALSEIARSDATEEAYIFDPETTRRSLDSPDMKKDLKKLLGVVKGQDSLAKGLREGAKMVAAGREFIAEDMFSLHVVCAGRNPSAVEADIDQCRELAAKFDGEEIADTIPKAARGNPFEPLNSILGSKGDRWAALNAKVAHSDAQRLIEATGDLLDGYRDKMRAAGVSVSFLYIAISNHAFSFEPVLRWFDEWLPVHRRTPEPEHLAKFDEPAANPLARELVAEIRARIVRLFTEFGAASNQIGKTYPYLDSLNPETAGLLRAIKRAVDGKGLINPGALGDFDSE